MATQKLFFHVGRSKTGTKPLQRFLSDHRGPLLSRGVHYVHADDRGAGLGHQRLAKSLIADPPAYMAMPADLRGVQDEVVKEIEGSPAPTLLLSSEHFLVAGPAALAAFARERLGIRDVGIIFFARSQDELIESLYNQMVKWAGYPHAFEDCVEYEMHEGDYAAILQPWADTFGRDRIHARIFDARADNLVDEFLSCLPLSPGEPLPRSAGRHNESVGYLALELYRTLNRFELKTRRTLYPELQKTLAPVDLPALFLDADGARRLRERYRDSNRRFLKDYLDRDGDDLRGRRYSDAERDAIRGRIESLRRR